MALVPRVTTARLPGALALALLVGACAPLAPGDPYPGWSAPLSTARLAERHCYRTLGEVDCHAQALPGEETRRVGFFDAPVAY